MLYVVRLSGEERERLETLIRKGKSPGRQVLKARIVLTADVSEAHAQIKKSAIASQSDAKTACTGQRKWPHSKGLFAQLMGARRGQHERNHAMGVLHEAASRGSRLQSRLQDMSPCAGGNWCDQDR